MLTKYEYARILLSLVNTLRENLPECKIAKDLRGTRIRNVQDIMDTMEKGTFEKNSNTKYYSGEIYLECPETEDFFEIYTFIRENRMKITIRETPKLDFLLFEGPDRKHVENLSGEEYDKLIEKIQYGPYSHEELKKKNMDRIATPEHLKTWQKLLQKHNLKTLKWLIPSLEAAIETNKKYGPDTIVILAGYRVGPILETETEITTIEETRQKIRETAQKFVYFYKTYKNKLKQIETKNTNQQ